jgi:Protein of unknown function (DUF2569)
MKKRPGRVGGWLWAYVIALAVLLLHGMGLTVAVIVIYSNQSTTSLHTFLPLGSLLVYVITNSILIFYTVLLFFLVFRKRHAAIVNNIAFNVLSILFVIGWHFLGEKSLVGTVIDATPGLVGLWYFLVSKRVRNTFAAEPQ